MKYVAHKRVPMRTHPQLSEKWIQELLAGNPSLLGLGDVDVKDIERRQPHAGRLDMLLTDGETNTRYEVELQLGPTDESHIIRAIEYWDAERKRYPQYDHVAVLVAEEITSRFFNVIGLFNGFIPMVAIQMSAIQVNEEEFTVVFTKVLDRTVLGTDEEDEGAPTDRKYWETKASPAMVGLADRILEVIRTSDPQVELKYTKFYIGLAKDGLATNYVALRPRKKHLIAEIRLPRTDETTALIEESGIGTLPYLTRWNQYRLTLTTEELEEYRELLITLIDLARENYNS
jgi:hypothetical protein